MSLRSPILLLVLAWSPPVYGQLCPDVDLNDMFTCGFPRLLNLSVGLRCNELLRSSRQLERAPQVSFQDISVVATYVLMMMDRDAPSPTNPSLARKINWFVYNIKGSEWISGNLEGDTVFDYTMPTSFLGVHRHQLLVFNQPPEFPVSAPPAIRERFDLDLFAHENHLCDNLAAAFEFRVTTESVDDPFRPTVYGLEEEGEKEERARHPTAEAGDDGWPQYDEESHWDGFSGSDSNSPSRTLVLLLSLGTACASLGVPGLDTALH